MTEAEHNEIAEKRGRELLLQAELALVKAIHVAREGERTLDGEYLELVRVVREELTTAYVAYLNRPSPKPKVELT